MAKNGSRLVKLGTISAAHGIRGQVKIHSLTEDPRDLTAYGPLHDAKGTLYEIAVTSATNDSLIASVKGVATRNEAESLRGTELFIAREALPKTGKHQYYHEDLVGLKLATEGGLPYGSIAAIHNFGAGDLVAIIKASGEEDLLPFTRGIFPSIDVEKGVGVIVPPEIDGDE